MNYQSGLKVERIRRELRGKGLISRMNSQLLLQHQQHQCWMLWQELHAHLPLRDSRKKVSVITVTINLQISKIFLVSIILAMKNQLRILLNQLKNHHFRKIHLRRMMTKMKKKTKPRQNESLCWIISIEIVNLKEKDNNKCFNHKSIMEDSTCSKYGKLFVTNDKMEPNRELVTVFNSKCAVLACNKLVAYRP